MSPENVDYLHSQGSFFLGRQRLFEVSQLLFAFLRDGNFSGPSVLEGDVVQDGEFTDQGPDDVLAQGRVNIIPFVVVVFLYYFIDGDSRFLGYFIEDAKGSSGIGEAIAVLDEVERLELHAHVGVSVATDQDFLLPDPRTRAAAQR